MKILEAARGLLPQISKDRRFLHQHPELAFNEFETAKFVASRLEALGFSVTTGIGQTGVVALSQAEAGKPVIMLRFDMDALPVIEANEVPYKSLTEGRMHACWPRCPHRERPGNCRINHAAQGRIPCHH